ncbi:Zinc-containing alcohol dehydrogenase superfamily [Actinokineospora spheciospongiae]|uniref:Zinc-containing alcohol dehydrogenase superfamily n=1 Tax=Actinokineospora spheciospongiae TaxID=909613 RepID=W7ISN3_9PSEU|nr:Zinc-containing alcohol dehydrogenase superfamily [Actinokineospora spheciospongiae]
MPLTLPHIPGLDVAGTIDALGGGVTDLGVGDRVVGFLPFVVDGAAAAGAHVIATGSPRRRDRLAAAGAAEVVDHTTTEVGTAVTEPVDVLLNLAPIDPAGFAALAALVRDGGVVVNTTVWMPAPADEERGVRGIDLYVRSDAGQLSELVARVDRGELTVDVAERVPLADLPSVHARAATGTLRGKVIVVPSTA